MELLKKFSTKELFNELQIREGVKTILIDPYQEYSITTLGKNINDSGAAAILIIID